MALKNDVEQVAELVDDFDFAINEECSVILPHEATLRSTPVAAVADRRRAFITHRDARIAADVRADLDALGSGSGRVVALCDGAQGMGGPVLALAEESAIVEAETPTWPQDKLSALRLGRRLVAEVPAAPGRRAFVDITPILDQRDDLAEREGWQRPDSQRSFRLVHWDCNERQLGGWDYDVDARQIRIDTATDESSLLRLVAEWGLTPAQFGYPWDTDDPR